MTTIRADILKPLEWVKFLLVAIIFSFILALVVPFLRDLAIENYTPRDYWFTYESVEPTRPAFGIDEKLTFYSAREIRKPILVNWKDKLFCDTNGVGGVGMRVISIYASEAYLRPHVIEKPGKPWTYQDAIPAVPARCYLESTTIAKLKYTTKVQTVKSGYFYIQ